MTFLKLKKRICCFLSALLAFLLIGQGILYADDLTDEEREQEFGAAEAVLMEDPAEEARRFSEDILDRKSVMAVLYLCTDYPLRAMPSEAAEETGRLLCGATLWLKKAVYQEDRFWFYVVSYDDGREYEGYIPDTQFVCVDRDYLSWKESGSFPAPEPMPQEEEGGVLIQASDMLMTQAKDSVYSFPDEYRDSLLILWNQHPNWIFVPQNTDTKFTDAKAGEYDDNKSWISSSAPEEYKLKPTGQSGWYVASMEALNFYMNPKNYLDERHVFAFEQLGYNESYHLESGVQTILSGTFMAGEIEGEGKTYSQAFMEIGKNRKVSPYHLASRVRQEQGTQGTSDLISGKYPGYEGYYNYFNVKASGKTKTEVILNGLKHAKEQGWDTRYRSLDGGAVVIAGNYVSAGQDTLYLEKYNVAGSTYPRYTHQYMQNVQAPYSESVTTYNQYNSAGTLKNPFVFKVPVYSDMAKSPDPVSGDEKAVMAELSRTARLFAATNKDAKLSAVKLDGLKVPEGITVRWKNPDTVLKADNGNPVRDYPAVYKKTNGTDQDFTLPVHVTKLGALKARDISNDLKPGYIKPEDTVQGMRELVYEVSGQATGYLPENGPEELGLAFHAGLSGKLKDGSSPVKILSAERTSPLGWQVRIGIPEEMQASLTDQSIGGIKFSFSYRYASSGQTKELLKSTKNVRVVQLDTLPVLESTVLSFDTWKQGFQPIGLLSQNGVSINTVRLLEGTAESRLFTVSCCKGEWMLGLTEEGRSTLQKRTSAYTKKHVLEITTADGKTGQKNLTIKALVKKPALTVKTVQKPNLYYAEGMPGSEAEYVLRSPIRIQSVFLKEEDESALKASGKPYFSVREYAEDGSLRLKVQQLNASNMNQAQKRQTFYVQFEGYDPVPYPLKIPVSNVKPVSKAEKAVLNASQVQAGFLLKGAEGEEVLLPEDTAVKGDDSAMELWVSPGRDGILMKAGGGFRFGQKTLTLESASWTKPVVLKTGVRQTDKPAIRLSKTKIRLNTALGLEKAGTQEVRGMLEGMCIPASLKGIRGKNGSAQALLDSGYLVAVFEEGRMRLGLDPAKRGGISPGKYGFYVGGENAENKDLEIKEAQLVISIEEKAPDALFSFGRKGSINVVDREGSFLALKPRTAGLGSESVNAVTLDSGSADLFRAQFLHSGERLPDGTKAGDGGVIVIQAKEDAPLKVKTSYPLSVTVVLENGVSVQRTISLRPVQSPKKTAGIPSKLTLPMNGTAARFTVASSALSATDSRIGSVELAEDENGKYFEFVPDTLSGNSCSFGGVLKVKESIRKTGEYNLKFKIRYRGHAADLGAKTIQLKLNVR